MNDDNLKLWNSVSETDVMHTKKAKKGAHHFTAITPMSQFKKATEMFGIQGIGWGIKIGSEVFQEQVIGTTNLLNYDAILFFKYDGEVGEISVHATEKLSYQTQGANGYLKIDDEVRKKVVTNAKTKGLSELGFNADIFMGQFDDPNYVEYISFEQSINKAEDKDQEIKIKIAEFNEWCKKEVSVYASVKNTNTLSLILGGHRQKIQGRCQLLNLDYASYSKGFEKAYNDQLTKINGEK